MSIFDSISGLFGGGSSTGASTGGYGAGADMSWLKGLAMLASSFKATPNQGASRQDVEKANRYNMLAGLLGAGAGMYAQRQDAQAKQNALQGLFDIYKNQGTEFQGPTLPGQTMPKMGLAESIFAFGKQHPGLSDQAMQLGLSAMQNDVQNKRYEQEFGFRQSQADEDRRFREQQFQAEQAYRNANLGLQRQQIGASQANAQANLQARILAQQNKAQQDALKNMTGLIPDADPRILAKIGMGQITERNPDYIPNAPMVPGVTAPEILRGEIPQNINLFEKGLAQQKEFKQLEKERPYINDALQRIQSLDLNQGYTDKINRYDDVVQMLDSGNFTQQMNALKSLTQMIDKSVVQGGEFTTAQNMLISNADTALRNAESWLGENKKPLTGQQVDTLKEMARIYATGAQRMLKTRMEAERNQLAQFGVSRPTLNLFDEYLKKDFSKPKTPAIQGLTPGQQLPNGYVFLGD